MEQPYKFLDYYEKSDMGIFFGREQETELLVSDIIATRLVVLFAKTGSGKTSLINAGVRPSLEELEYATFYVRVEQDPTESARKVLRETLENQLLSGWEEESLATQLEGAVDQLGQPIVVFFDQFEEFFTHTSEKHPEKAQQFISEIAKVYRNRECDVYIVFSMREEFFHEMDAFRDEIPSIFHKDSNLRLRGFDEDQARDAIVLPAKKFETEVEESLVDLLVSDLAEHRGIELPSLQIVCDTLWREKSNGVIRLEDYERLGRAKNILDQRLEEDIRRLDYDPLWFFKRLLPELITEHDTRRSQEFGSLLSTLKIDERSLRDLVDNLKELRLLRERNFDGENYIEWMSDYLAGRTDYLQERVDAILLQKLLQLFKDAIHEPDLPDDVAEGTDERLQDEALSKFYDSAAKRVAQDTDIKEGDLREWFVTSLITPTGERGTVYRKTSGIPHEALDILKKLHFIREESQGGVLSYQLAHDRLVAPIHASNQEWLTKRVGADRIRQELEHKAEEWASRGKSRDYLLKEAELSKADQLADSNFSPSRALLALVETSREVAHRRRVVRRTVTAIAFGFLAMLALALAVVAFHQGRAAEQRQIEAEGASAEAIKQRDIAEKAKGEEAKQRQLAEQRSKEAEGAKEEEAKQRQLAEKRRIEAEEAEEEEAKQRQLAEQRSKEAEDAKEEEAKQRQLAEQRQIEAEGASAEAIKQRDIAEKAKAEEAKQRQFAEERQIEAEEASAEAIKQRDIAEKAKAEEAKQRQFAEERQIEAEEAKKKEEEQRERAEKQSQIILARNLATQADLAGNLSADLRVLLAVESVKRLPSSVEDVQVLRERLARVANATAARMNHQSYVYSAVFSRDGRYLATASNDRIARIWEIPDGQEVVRINHRSDLNSVAFSPDGKYLATAGDAAAARIWEVATKLEVTRMNHESGVNCVTFSPDGGYLATTSNDGAASIWAVMSSVRRVQMSHESDVISVVFSPDGEYVATAGDGGTAWIWEVSSGQEAIRINHGSALNSVAFSPDGKYLATAGDDKTARIWKLSTRQEEVYMAHDDLVYSICFSPDGRYLATASKDRTARIWRVADGMEVARMDHRDEVYSVCFSPDDRYLATASRDKTAQVWFLLPEDLIAKARSYVKRNLTRDEWSQHIGDEEPYRKTWPDLPASEE